MVVDKSASRGNDIDERGTEEVKIQGKERGDTFSACVSVECRRRDKRPLRRVSVRLGKRMRSLRMI